VTSAPSVTPPPTLSLPPQGIFTDCDISTSLPACAARLAIVAHAGLKILVQPLPPAGLPLLEYVSALKSSGLEAMWEITDPGWWGYNGSAPFGYDRSAANMLAVEPSWAVACGCQSNADLLTFIASRLESTGLTYGFYVADDSQFEGSDQPYQLGDVLSGLQRFSADLHAAASGAKTMISAWGLSDSAVAARASASADLVGEEMYPFASYGGSAVSAADAISEVTEAARADQRIADTNGAESAFILQAFSWGECAPDTNASGTGATSAYPAAPEMSSLRDAVLGAARPSLLLWYSLEETIGWPAGQQPSGCTAPPDPVVRLDALTSAVTAPYPTPARAVGSS
jgi:hypothetical protein